MEGFEYFTSNSFKVDSSLTDFLAILYRNTHGCCVYNVQPYISCIKFTSIACTDKKK